MSDENNFAPENIFIDNESDPGYKPRSFLRSSSNVVIAGVCAGTARYFNVDPGNIRLIAILSSLFGSLPILIYIIAALIIPKEKDESTLSEKEIILLRKENTKTVLGGILLLTGIYYALSILGLNDGNHLLIVRNDWLISASAISAAIYIFTKYDQSVLPRYNSTLHFNKLKEGKLLLGVCKGLSDYTGISVDIIRLFFVIAFLLTLGLFALIYLSVAVSAKYGFDNDVQ